MTLTNFAIHHDGSIEGWLKLDRCQVVHHCLAGAFIAVSCVFTQCWFGQLHEPHALWCVNHSL